MVVAILIMDNIKKLLRHVLLYVAGSMFLIVPSIISFACGMGWVCRHVEDQSVRQAFLLFGLGGFTGGMLFVSNLHFYLMSLPEEKIG